MKAGAQGLLFVLPSWRWHVKMPPPLFINFNDYSLYITPVNL